MLHIVNTSPFSDLSLEKCIDRMQPQDGLILIEDATYALNQLEVWQSRLTPECKLYVLQDDAIARGLCVEQLELNWVSYDEFVGLTLSYPKTLSW
ncbi:sulfurtransferase complex subunit TusB [Neptunicella sp. SCSIO 80796]|uniref:sulfurtransferase complex subunit TusB n=1 Tax=Neptunicella plasticusilytica TaxID=3117012 RepID=UPI003A4D995C